MSLSEVTPDPLCGTYQGYQRHIRHREPTCVSCRKASAAYQAHHRAANPSYAARDRARNRARGRAATRLQRMFPAQFLTLYSEELAKEEL